MFRESLRCRNLLPWLLLASLSSSSLAGPPITALAISPDGRQLLTGSQAGLSLLPLPDLRPVKLVPTRLQQIHDIRFSPDGKQFLAAGGIPGESGVVELHQWPQLGEFQQLKAGEDLVYGAEWLDAGTSLAAVGADGICRLLQTPAVATAASAGSVADRSVYSGHSQAVLAIHRLNETQLVTAGADQTLRLWDFKTLMTRRSFNNHTGSVLDLVVRPIRSDAEAAMRLVATAGADRTVRLWNPAQGRMLRFAKLSSVPLSLSWTSDGERLLVGCSSGDLHELGVATFAQRSVQQLAGLRIEELLVLPGDQSVVVGCSDGEVRLLPLDSDQRN
ncbi:MAG: hypothetical protein RLZZ436_4070 [Planctomycetota bacterium]|jgi:WD40 repeat protein